MLESITKSADETKVFDLCAPLLAAQGFNLVDLDCRIGGQSMVRLFIERSAEATVSLDDCALVSREIGPVLEGYDLIPGGFDLEVSSPGLDRRMRLRSDFEGAIGFQVKLRLSESVPGIGTKPSGLLKRVDENGILLEVDKRDNAIGWNKIRQANRVWPGPAGESSSGPAYRN